jgi:hypothetical protein
MAKITIELTDVQLGQIIACVRSSADVLAMTDKAPELNKLADYIGESDNWLAVASE